MRNDERIRKAVYVAEEWFNNLSNDESKLLIEKHKMFEYDLVKISEMWLSEGKYIEYINEQNRQIDIENTFKFLFKIFFEGLEGMNDQIYESYINKDSFGISDFVFTHTTLPDGKFNADIEIYLSKPGLLVGKAGKTIDALVEYVSGMLEDRTQIKISLKETNVWKREEKLS